MKNRYFLEIAFNGSNYHGWQVQLEAITVQGEMNKHISIILGEKIVCHGCGRTDSGVHATKYLLHFDTEKELNDTFRKKLDRFLPLDILVRKMYSNQEKIHARFDALQRSYRYVLSKGKDPFNIDLVTITYSKYDIDLMNQACKIVIENKEFEAFSKSNNSHNHYLCDVLHAEWKETNSQYIFEITANRFVRSMIRLMVGTMIQVGTGKITVEDFKEILKNKNRTKSGKAVSAQGLYFTDVKFPDEKLILMTT